MIDQFNNFAAGFLLMNAVMLLILPLNWAILPLLIGACFMTLGQGVEIGSYNFTIIRMLIGVGFVRVALRRERFSGSIISLDWLVLVWAGWALISSVFHNDPDQAFVNRLGLTYDVCGIYILFRCFCKSVSDLVGIFRMIAILIMPIAIFMLFERMTGQNIFAVFGGVPEFSENRDGIFRAQGPFLHSILAGTVGAVCLPFMFSLWQQHRKISIAGLTACVAIILASGSSGPILSALAGIGALFMWRYRNHMRLVRWIAVLGYFSLDIVMNAPAYYLIARFSPIGSSTGWHRARLIESSLEHFSEWWLVGTDYTRHWMPTGVLWSSDHTDITSHYIKMGVLGGLPLMLLFISILAKGFQCVGKSIENADEENPHSSFILWTIGSSLFVHVASCISVSYFDQSFIFLYLTLAMIASAWSSTIFKRKSPKSI
jgi:hypothetical protein